MSEIDDMIFHLLADIQNLSAITENYRLREKLSQYYFQMKDDFINAGYLKKEESVFAEDDPCEDCRYNNKADNYDFEAGCIDCIHKEWRNGQKKYAI